MTVPAMDVFYDYLLFLVLIYSIGVFGHSFVRLHREAIITR